MAVRRSAVQRSRQPVGAGRRASKSPAHGRDGAYRSHPGDARRRPYRGVHRIPRPALHRPRTGQRRNSLLPRRHARRSARAGGVDDLEVRGGKHSFRRRERRRHLRSGDAVHVGVGAHHAALHRRDHRIHRPGARRARARHEHQRANDGLDHGHLFHAHAPYEYRGRHRQTAGAGRFVGQTGSHRPRLHDRHHAGAAPARHGTRIGSSGDPRLRQRRRNGR